MPSKHYLSSPAPDELGPQRADASMRVHVAYGVLFDGDDADDAQSKPRYIEIFSGGPDSLPTLKVRLCASTQLDRTVTIETQGECTLDLRDARRVLDILREMIGY